MAQGAWSEPWCVAGSWGMPLLGTPLLCRRGKEEGLGKRVSDLAAFPGNLLLVIAASLTGARCALSDRSKHWLSQGAMKCLPRDSWISSKPHLLSSLANHQLPAVNTASSVWGKYMQICSSLASLEAIHITRMQLRH